jgi:hypothetical protein
MVFESAIPCFDIGHCFAKILVVTNSGVDGIHTALAHLSEDFF